MLGAVSNPTPAPPVRVSVVLPVWNGQRFIADALKSVLDQTFTDFELIVVDDGSDDATLAIVRQHTAQDSRIRTLERPKLGLVAALNAGLAAARGTFIARMDADDISHPTRLARQVEYLDRNPRCVAVGASIDIVDDRRQLLGGVKFALAHDAIVDALLNGRTGLAHPTTLMRRCAVTQVGGYLEDAYPSEDRDLWLRMSPHGLLANLDETLLMYRRSADTVAVQCMALRQVSRERVINRARQTRGMPVWREGTDTLPALTPNGRYHLDCARTALGSGRRRLAFAHLCRGMQYDPWTWQHVTTFMALGVPRQVTTQVVAQFRRLQLLT